LQWYISQKYIWEHLYQRRDSENRNTGEKKRRKSAGYDSVRQSTYDQAQDGEQDCKQPDGFIEGYVAKYPGEETHNSTRVAAFAYGDAGTDDRHKERGKPGQPQIRKNHALENIDNNQQQRMENY